MDEILKSEIFIVVYDKSEGVSFEEFGGLFRQVHGYYLKLSNYGYTSMRALLNDMNDLVEVKTINGQPRIRCKSPSRHVVVSNVYNLPYGTEQVSGRSSVPLPSSGPSSGPAVKKTNQAQPTPALQQRPVKVKNTNSATVKKLKETLRSQYCQPAEIPKIQGFPANHKPPTSKPIPAGSAGNAANATGAAKTKKVSTTNQKNTSTFINPKSGSKMPPPLQNVSKKSKETLKPQYCQPPKNPIPAVKQTSSPQPGFSSHGKTAKIQGFPANHKPLTSKPVPAAPAVHSAIAAGAAKTKKVSSAKQKNTYTFSNPKSRTKIQPPLQNVSSAKISTFEGKTYLASTGQNKKAALLPTPTVSLQGSPFLINYIPQVVHPGIKPNVSYASACRSNLNMNQFNHSGQQFPPNNPRFIVDPPRVTAPNVPQASRSELRPSIQSGSIIKENIELLLNQHDNGLSIFQLQKLYLIKFQQPLKFRGSSTLKLLLMELKDVVKTKGIGVQMLVYPVPARKNPSTPDGGERDAALQATVSLLTRRDLQGEVASNQHSADSSKSQTDQLQEAAQSSFSDDHVLVPELTTKNGLSQNASQDFSLPQIILHSSGFSFLMKQQIPDPHKVSDMEFNTGSCNEQKSLSHNNMFHGPKPLPQILPRGNASTLLPDTKPQKSLVPHGECTEHVRLQPVNSISVTGTHGQKGSPLQTSVNFQTESCYTSEYPALPTRRNFKTKSTLVPVGEPPSKQKSNAQIIKIEQAAPFNEKDVQTKNVMETTSPDEASISTPTNDPTKIDNPCVPGTEQAEPMSSDVQKTVYVHPSQMIQNKPTPQKEQFEEFSTPDRITQADVLSSELRQGFDRFPQNPPQKSLVPYVEITEHTRLQPHNSINVTGTHGQKASPLKTSVNFHTENCYTSEYPVLPMRSNFKTKPTLVPIEEPPSKQKGNAQIIKVEQAAPSKEKDVQTKNVMDKTSPDEASISTPINDPTKTDDPYVPVTEQDAPMSSDVQKTVNVHPSQMIQNKPSPQKEQFEEFSTPDRITQASVLSSELRQEFESFPQNTSNQQGDAVEHCKLQNNLEITSEEDMSTWQTSQKQVCCIL